jgi:hypothetical protein|tara:strand:+ start:315 stop:668 length:354 start_codon:yes stop_codon:yes gene_type:complete
MTHKVADAVRALLGNDDFIIRGEPSNETEFNKMFSKITSVVNDTAVESKDPNDFGVTWSEVQAKMTEQETAYNNDAYKRKREFEYPPIAEQLDDLYHNGIDGWKSTIKAIKDKYPKG